MMEPADLFDRLAAVDHELSRTEALRALAQTNGNDSEVQRLDEEIRQLSKVRDQLRTQLKGSGSG
jgi:hypothetical protein